MTGDLQAMREEIPRLRDGFAGLMGRMEAEFAGLDAAQMAFRRDEPVWARWSAEQQLRHMAKVLLNVVRVWFPDYLGGRGYALPEVDMEAVGRGGQFLPPEVAPDRDALYAFMRPLVALYLEILDRETPESLRATVGARYRSSNESYPDSSERSIDFWRTAAKVHPFGVREDPRQSGRFEVELGAGIRQMYWEMLAHLRSVQRLKALQGIAPAAPLPREGYLTLEKFHD